MGEYKKSSLKKNNLMIQVDEEGNSKIPTELNSNERLKKPQNSNRNKTHVHHGGDINDHNLFFDSNIIVISRHSDEEEEEVEEDDEDYDENEEDEEESGSYTG